MIITCLITSTEISSKLNWPKQFFYPRSEGYKKCAVNKSAYMKNKVISSFFYSELT